MPVDATAARRVPEAIVVGSSGSVACIVTFTDDRFPEASLVAVIFTSSIAGALMASCFSP
jgi:hypothetical protein